MPLGMGIARCLRVARVIAMVIVALSRPSPALPRRDGRITLVQYWISEPLSQSRGR
jgi:hypothetical protein